MKSPIPADERLIFALDFADPDVAKAWVKRLGGKVKFFKIGLQLFLAGGWNMVDFVTSCGYKLMLDLKFHDIPETVHLAVAELANRGINLTTIHAEKNLIQAAVASKGDIGLLAVSVLTSMNQQDLAENGIAMPLLELVRLRAKLAIECGCDGVVSSALECTMLRQELGNEFISLTPGIRLAHEQKQQDQKRIMTPRRALENGADYLVIGRPIREAGEPERLVEEIQAEIAIAANRLT